MRLRSLTTRFLLTLSLSAVLPALVLGYLVAGQASGRLQQRSVEINLIAPAARAAESLNEKLAAVRGSFARLKKVADDFLDEEMNVGDFEDRVYDEMNVGTVLLEGVVLVGADGGVEHALFELPTSRDVASVADEPWFRQLTDPDDPRFVVWVSQHLSRFRHANPQRASRDPQDYSLGIAASVSGKGGKRGALLGLVSWSLIQDVLDSTARDMERAGLASARAFLLPASRLEYLAHTEREQYGVSPPVPIARAHFVDGVALSSLREDDETLPYRAALVQTKDPARFGWWTGVVADDVELHLEGRSFVQVVVLLTGATSVLLVVWSLLVSRAIARPIGRLVTATQAVGRGELGVRVDAPEEGGDEIAELGRAFNDMSTELVENRKLLAQAERRAAWAEMARQVAHEIKNPLTPMRMGAQLMLRARSQDDPRWESLSERLARTVIDQTDELRRIADDFRAFAGSGGGPEGAAAPVRESIPASRVLQEVADAFRATAELRKIDFHVHDESQSALVSVDPGAMRRVLLNLVQNAFDAVTEGAAATPRESEFIGRVDLRAMVSGDRSGRVAFTVSDDGPGIADDVRDRLFDPYFTTRSSGTGLGLAICRRIAEEHDGSIVVVEGGAGATQFRVELPRVPDE